MNSNNYKQAARLLSHLDFSTTRFTFQAFDDKKSANKELARWFHGTLQEHWQRLVALNEQGAGIFVMVNAGDGTGRNAAAVTRIRAIFNEYDHGLISILPLPPQIIVETSPGHTHHWILCDGLEKDEFCSIQQRLINDHQSDPRAKDIPRVLRLPGFYHHKKEPHLVTIINETPFGPYSREQIIQAFPPVIPDKPKRLTFEKSPIIITDVLISELKSALDHLDPDDYHEWVSVGCALYELGEAGYELWNAWSQRSVKWENKDASRWNTFTNDRTGYQSVFSKAQAGGWDNPSKSTSVDVTSVQWSEDLKTPPSPPDMNYCKLDLLRHLPDSHIMKRLSKEISKTTWIHESTVFMTGIGVFSGMATKTHCIIYRDGKRLPMGLYVALEHPSGSSKSQTINYFTGSFVKIYEKAKQENRALLERLGDDEESDEAKQAAIEQRLLMPRLWVSNATPEALDPILKSTGGFFNIVSSEQGLANSLFGYAYNKQSTSANNNDTVTYGFNGDYLHTARITREAYSGYAAGAITLFAQNGLIQKVLNAAVESGVSERFVFICEPHPLGRRDHLKYHPIDPLIFNEYQENCEFIREIFKQKLSLFDLSTLTISSHGFKLIALYRNSFEYELRDGGDYSNVALRGFAAKIDMNIMKLAANLHLSDNNKSSMIPDSLIQASINILDEILKGVITLCTVKGLLGKTAEEDAVLSIFEKDNHERTERQICMSRSKVSPFKEMSGNRYNSIKSTIYKLCEKGALKCIIKDSINYYKLGN